MEESIKFIHQTISNSELYPVTRFGPEHAQKVLQYHESFPEYKVTPLFLLNEFAKKYGIRSVVIKDESYRFGIGSFKVLGGSYAIGNYIAQKLHKSIHDMTYAELMNDDIRKETGNITFVTATDGNHGRGVAWTANQLKQKSVIYMPKGSSMERLHHIQKLGAEASITDMNYDDAVRYANKLAEKNGWVMVQDTSWDGYEDIPGWIMEGYSTMAHESAQQMKQMHIRPTHIFLQAGVGAMAGAVAGYFADLYGDKNRPIVTIVEPNKADCIFRTVSANDGEIHCVKGFMDSIMAGLCCGEPCTIGWKVLHDHADNFVSIPDYIAGEGMRILGNPLQNDPRIISGESGAAGFGLLAEALRNPNLDWLRDKLKLDSDSVVLCFSTEGATDLHSYEEITWDGKHPSQLY